MNHNYKGILCTAFYLTFTRVSNFFLMKWSLKEKMIRNISEKRRVVCDWFESSRFPKKVERFRREDSSRARRLVIHLNGSSTRQAQLQPRQKTVRERAASSYDVRGLCSLLVPSTYSRVLVFSSLKGEKEEGLRARVLRHSTEHIADIVKASLLSRFARRRRH